MFVRAAEFTRALFVASVILIASAVAAQSYLPAYRVGEGRNKTWDEIPSPRQTSSPIDYVTPPSQPENYEASWLPPDIPRLERRLGPDAAQLQQYFQSILAAKDDKAVKAAGWRLDMPDAEGWFCAQFGAELGSALAEEYNAVRRSLGNDFVNLVKGLRGRKQTSVRVILVRTARDPDANEVQRRALQLMKQPTSLYEVRFGRPGVPGGHVIHSFAYIDGMFRYLGKMQAVMNAPAPSNTPAPEVLPDPFAPTM